MTIIKVSRQGLTLCPACSKHIQVAEQLEETACPFCQAEFTKALVTANRAPGPLQRLAGSGRSAVIAASLMGMPMVGVACADGESTPGDPVDMVADSMADSMAGSGSDSMGDSLSDITVFPDSEEMSYPVYGMPAEDIGPMALEEDTAGDVTVVETE